MQHVRMCQLWRKRPGPDCVGSESDELGDRHILEHVQSEVLLLSVVLRKVIPWHTAEGSCFPEVKVLLNQPDHGTCGGFWLVAKPVDFNSTQKADLYCAYLASGHTKVDDVLWH